MSRDAGEILDQLLAKWREARHASTSELIQQIGDRLRVEVSRLPAAKSEAAKRLVESISTEPAFLLSARLKQLQEFARVSSGAVLWPVFEALAKLPADPRVATLATRLLVGDASTELTSKLTRRLLDCVEAHGDDSHFRSLELGFPLHLQDDSVAARTARMLQRERALRPEGAELPLAERKQLLAEKNWEVPEAPVPVASLFAPVWEKPRDLARRQVLADVLLERGDPRGEFISLQLAKASPDRQRALLKAHAHAWSGALEAVLDWKHGPPAFEDGFISEVSVLAVKPGQFNLVRDAEDWATVRRVRQGLQRFGKHMRSLEDAGRVRLEAVKAAVREKIPLHLRSIELLAGPDEAADVLETLEHMPRWVALFLEWGVTRDVRDALPRLADLQGVERLRFSSRELPVMVALLGQTGLGWLPRHVKRIELRRDAQLMIFERDRKAWSLDLVDLSRTAPRLIDWKEALVELSWLHPTQVRLLTRHDVESVEVKELEHLARRFELPVAASMLTEVPEELAW